MTARLYEYALPWRLSVLLALTVILGGTSLAVTTLKVPLYYISVIFIAQALITRRRPLSHLWCGPVILGAVFLGLYTLYLVPLPPGIWSALSGRELVSESYSLTEIDPEWLPLTLSPQRAFLGLFHALPVIAIACILRLSATRQEIKHAEKTIICAALLSLLMGMIDVLTNAHIFSVYENYTEGFPTGVFTNINHQATLLAMALPLAVFFIFRQKTSHDREGMRASAIAVMAAIVLALGLVLARSSAGYIFLVVNLFLAVFIMKRDSAYAKLLLLPIVGLCLASVIDAVVFGGEFRTLLRNFTAQSTASRGDIFTTSYGIIKTFGLFGIGPGAFETVYRIFEDSAAMNPRFINQAHNDYLQTWMAFGVFGLAWMGASVLWFARKLWQMFSTGTRSRRKAMIYALCIATVLVHSLIDYPLRTMSIAGVFCFVVLRFDSLVTKRMK